MHAFKSKIKADFGPNVRRALRSDRQIPRKYLVSILFSAQPNRLHDIVGRFTSYAAAGDNFVNQVWLPCNGLGKLATEYRSHSGAVNVNSTPKLQYAYSEMSCGANYSAKFRLRLCHLHGRAPPRPVQGERVSLEVRFCQLAI